MVVVMRLFILRRNWAQKIQFFCRGFKTHLMEVRSAVYFDYILENLKDKCCMSVSISPILCTSTEIQLFKRFFMNCSRILSHVLFQVPVLVNTTKYHKR